MQTFLPFAHFAQSALVLDDKRLGKQRVECLQILHTLEKIHNAKDYMELRDIPWASHPAVLMWEGHEGALLAYTFIIIKEWKRRGFEDSCWKKAVEFGRRVEETLLQGIEPFEMPEWFGWGPFHESHRSNLLKKDPQHYVKHFDVPDDLPYFWPTEEGF